MELGERLARAIARETSSGAVDRPLLRALLLLTLAVTLLLTWPLWQARGAPLPNLPLGGLPSPSMGVALLASLALAALRPKVGVPVVAALFGVAAALDQTRIQPEIVSLVLLLFGTLPWVGGLTVARAHLLAQWSWAGLHKLLSPDFLGSWGHGLQERLAPGLAEVSLPAIGAGATELAIAVALLVGRTRRIGAAAACALHLGLFGMLLAIGTNPAVAPWNLALAATSVALFARWEGPVIPERAPLRLAAAAILLMPAGFYLGVVDAYLAHCLYSRNVPVASLEGEWVHETALRELGAPFPPQPRLYRALLARVGRPGEVMTIVEGRPPYGETRVPAPAR